MWTRHALEGLLLGDRRGFVLRIDDGGDWRLDPSWSLARRVGQRVAVTGVRDGFDLLAPDWVGAPGEAPRRSWWRR